jgi:hypothetical protein
MNKAGQGSIRIGLIIRFSSITRRLLISPIFRELELGGLILLLLKKTYNEIDPIELTGLSSPNNVYTFKVHVIYSLFLTRLFMSEGSEGWSRC